MAKLIIKRMGGLDDQLELEILDPIGSPEIALEIFPGWKMLKTTIGILLSLQRAIAVLSITPISLVSTS